jgi:hypothetical protein
MTPELAKKLHDNGFPNLAVYAHSFNHEPNDNPHKGGWNVKATCKFCGEVREYASSSTLSTTYFEGCPVISNYIFPTLSELIEACGEDFRGLLKGTFLIWNKDIKNYEDFIGFFAGELDGTDGSCLYVDSEPHGYGSTPEIAVAKLWLELNKKI